jgi:hypothetical protein
MNTISDGGEYTGKMYNGESNQIYIIAFTYGRRYKNKRINL